MTTLMIKNLPMDKLLDRKAMAAVHGGNGMADSAAINFGPRDPGNYVQPRAGMDNFTSLNDMWLIEESWYGPLAHLMDPYNRDRVDLSPTGPHLGPVYR